MNQKNPIITAEDKTSFRDSRTPLWELVERRSEFKCCPGCHSPMENMSTWRIDSRNNSEIPEMRFRCLVCKEEGYVKVYGDDTLAGLVPPTKKPPFGKQKDTWNNNNGNSKFERLLCAYRKEYKEFNEQEKKRVKKKAGENERRLRKILSPTSYSRNKLSKGTSRRTVVSNMSNRRRKTRGRSAVRKELNSAVIRKKQKGTTNSSRKKLKSYSSIRRSQKKKKSKKRDKR